MIYQKLDIVSRVLRTQPRAMARLHGRDQYSDVVGDVYFYDSPLGRVVQICVANLPQAGTGFFGIHIHEVGECDGDYSSAGPHFDGDSHPRHKGDMPPLLNAGGRAYSVFLDDRFEIDDIIGRAVILHAQADDFTSQPAGNSGARIACGVIHSM